MASIPELKALLRKDMRKRLAALSSNQIIRESTDLANQLFALREYQTAQSISVYLSKDGAEVSTDMIVQDILSRGTKCFIPRCISPTKMEMVRLLSMEDLESLPLNKMKIREPLPTESRENALDGTEGLDLIVMPGLAFDKAGWRLGYGAGYYDRYLSECDTFSQKHGKPPPKTIALALASQIVDEDIPRDEYDRKPDRLLIAPRH
ncbi:hypothetical protein HDU76_003089 [Blyttiomyces sp. JEL0837]|nr:hypothetical protein HDU76_003089 [Blyttiomyces sp. JEL0837]